MEQEECLKSLKRVLAQAVVLGMRMSERPFAGVIWEDDNLPLWDGLQTLHDRTAEFLELSKLGADAVARVLPLHLEMQSLVETGGQS